MIGRVDLNVGPPSTEKILATETASGEGGISLIERRSTFPISGDFYRVPDARLITSYYQYRNATSIVYHLNA